MAVPSYFWWQSLVICRQTREFFEKWRIKDSTQLDLDWTFTESAYPILQYVENKLGKGYHNFVWFLSDYSNRIKRVTSIIVTLNEKLREWWTPILKCIQLYKKNIFTYLFFPNDEAMKHAAFHHTQPTTRFLINNSNTKKKNHNFIIGQIIKWWNIDCPSQWTCPILYQPYHLPGDNGILTNTKRKT